MNVYLVVGMDCECDKGDLWRVRHPLSFRNIVEGIPLRLHPLFRELGLKPTYLIGGEVIRDEASTAMFRSLSGPLELGAHLHPEHAEPWADWGAAATLGFLGDLDPDKERSKLEALTQAFRLKFGFPPKSFRAGRFALGPKTLAHLESLGYEADSSVTPDLWWAGPRGGGVNYLGAPRMPYRPRLDDVRRMGNARILEVPVSIVRPFWNAWPRAAKLGLRPFHPVLGRAMNLMGASRAEARWLRPTFSTAEHMRLVAERLIRESRGGAVVLNMMFHSNEATIGASPYVKTAAELSMFLDRLRRFFELLSRAYRVQPVGLADIAGIHD